MPNGTRKKRTKDERVTDRSLRRKTRQTATTKKRGTKAVAAGKKLEGRMLEKRSKRVSKGRKTGEVGRKAPKKRTRYRLDDAREMIAKGEEMVKSPATSRMIKPRKRIKRTTPAVGRPGMVRTRKGKIKKRK